MLAIDPSVGKWIARVDPSGYANRKFSPGSAIKPFTVIAALESHASAEMVIHCASSNPATPVRDACWYRPGHGSVDLEKAIAYSCDRYFRELARGIKWTQFLDVLSRFGLVGKGDRAALDALGGEERLDIMTGLSAKVKVSPASLLSAYAALFNGGYLFVDRAGENMAIKRRIQIGNKTSALLVAGLIGATRYGTASEVGKAFPGREILSKTGTAVFSDGETVYKSRTHGWYVGVSPARTPHFAMVIFIPIGAGARDAVPAAIQFWPELLKHAPL